MKWLKFEDKENNRNRFLNFVRENCTKLLNELSSFEKTLFYHFWHKIFNEHDCYLLIDGERTYGFVSKPQWNVKHWIRWPENYLIIDKTMKEKITLPEPFAKEHSFRTNNSQQINIENTKVTQTAYVCPLDNFEFKLIENINENIVCHELTEKANHGILNLLDRNNRHADVKAGFYEDYYLPELIKNISDNHINKTGYCFYATLKNSDKPIAISYYDGFEMPFTGTPCLLINDIIVSVEHRKKRVATTLQAYAYEKLKQHNVKWVLGNIEPDNTSSIKQAQALKRYEWTSVVEI